jgi:hypothetical protein
VPDRQDRRLTDRAQHARDDCGLVRGRPTALAVRRQAVTGEVEADDPETGQQRDEPVEPVVRAEEAVEQQHGRVSRLSVAADVDPLGTGVDHRVGSGCRHGRLSSVRWISRRAQTVSAGGGPTISMP